MHSLIFPFLTSHLLLSLESNAEYDKATSRIALLGHAHREVLNDGCQVSLVLLHRLVPQLDDVVRAQEDRDGRDRRRRVAESRVQPRHETGDLHRRVAHETPADDVAPASELVGQDRAPRSVEARCVERPCGQRVAD